MKRKSGRSDSGIFPSLRSILHLRALAWTLSLLLLVLLAVCLGRVYGSRGDNDPDYKKCVQTCVKTNACDNPALEKAYTERLPFALRLFGWSCSDNCQYDCMWTMVRAYREKGFRVEQYYGKWPFIRVFGMQEIASVVFSIGNALAHILGYRAYHRVLARRHAKAASAWYMTPFYTANVCINVTAWIASTIFHSRDNDTTQLMDYFMATMVMSFALYYTLIRLGNVRSRLYQAHIFLLFALGYLYHVYYLYFVEFNFTYNMVVNVAIGITFNAIWLVWTLANYRARAYAADAGAFALLITLCGLLEVFDFAPFFDLVDAHALWHAATVPLVLIWYRFLRNDALYHVSSSNHLEKYSAEHALPKYSSAVHRQ